MADETPKNTPGPFDVRTIKALVTLMTQHDLSEIDLREGVQRLRLRRGTSPQPVMASMLPVASMPQAPPPTSIAPASDSAAAPSAPARKLIEIKSQMVGTFYSSPNPDAPPFVKVGAKLTPTTVVGLIEAMKLFNEVAAECTGVLVEILVDNQQPVEFGQVLMRVDPAA